VATLGCLAVLNL
jgi:protein phosphatase 1 regulatory subunit 7